MKNEKHRKVGRVKKKDKAIRRKKEENKTVEIDVRNKLNDRLTQIPLDHLKIVDHVETEEDEHRSEKKKKPVQEKKKIVEIDSKKKATENPEKDDINHKPLIDSELGEDEKKGKKKQKTDDRRIKAYGTDTGNESAYKTGRMSYRDAIDQNIKSMAYGGGVEIDTESYEGFTIGTTENHAASEKTSFVIKSEKDVDIGSAQEAPAISYAQTDSVKTVDLSYVGRVQESVNAAAKDVAFYGAAKGDILEVADYFTGSQQGSHSCPGCAANHIYGLKDQILDGSYEGPFKADSLLGAINTLDSSLKQFRGIHKHHKELTAKAA